MKRINASHLMLAIISMVAGLVFARPQLTCAEEISNPAQANAIPAVESVTDRLAFIRWTTANPGGTVLHYAVVQYGKDPNHLGFTAQSPNRINPSHSEMVFRVRMPNLEPGTTYYYKVSSEQANGKPDPAMSGVNQITTQPTNPMSAKQ
jgi:hypothetical protein